jgi:hypothetical protein
MPGENFYEQKKMIEPSCASCKYEILKKACFKEKGKGDKGCPTLTQKKCLRYPIRLFHPFLLYADIT